MDGPNLILPGGGGQYDFDAVFPPPVYAAGTTTANNLWMTLTRVSRPLTITKICILVTTALGNVDAGYYTDDNADGTYDLQAHSGSIVMAGSGAAEQALTLLTPITLLPSRNYWRALLLDNASASIHRGTGWGAVGAGIPLFNIGGTVTFATAPGLPATVSGMTTGQNILPFTVGKP